MSQLSETDFALIWWRKRHAESNLFSSKSNHSLYPICGHDFHVSCNFNCIAHSTQEVTHQHTAQSSISEDLENNKSPFSPYHSFFPTEKLVCVVEGSGSKSYESGNSCLLDHCVLRKSWRFTGPTTKWTFDTRRYVIRAWEMRREMPEWVVRTPLGRERSKWVCFPLC